jgi:uncharacterized protein
MEENPYESTSENENRKPRSLNEKSVEVVGVWEAQGGDTGEIRETFVKLRDSRGRELPIFIGPFETMAILRALNGVAPERPFTHDLLRTAIERLGGQVERVVIDDLWQRTYYAKIYVRTDAAPALEIDARPSDAIALALRTRAPLFVAESVLADAGQGEETLE